MTDKEKLDKLVAEIERLIGDYNIKTEKCRGMNEQAHQYYGGKRDALSEILKSIVSMQEESINNGLDLGCGVIWKEEESASEDFKIALEKKVREAQDWTYIEEEGGECPLNEEFGAYDLEEFARWGANWQKEQFEKNRLKHCNSITNEQAELEQGFIDQHLDKYQRMPTFLDAIEYGMDKIANLMAEKATDAVVHTDAGDYPYIPQLELYDYDKDIPLAKEGDKYKVILIKED